MKKTFALVALVAGALSFTSCNKNLKDDIKELKSQLGTNEPITATTSFTDRDNIDRTITQTFKFKSSNLSTQYMIKNSDGTYDIYIERFIDVDWDEAAWVGFRYDPATKKLTDKAAGHYWDQTYNANDEVYVYVGDQNPTGLTFDINIKNIDLTNGDIDLEVNIAGTKEYSSQNGGNVPNINSSFKTNFSFKGKLGVFARSTQNPS